MRLRNQTYVYYFTVEGNSEQLYLEHVKNLIDNEAERKHNVKFHIKQTNNIRKFFKNLANENIDVYTHLWDKEADNKQEEFEAVLENIKMYSDADNIFCGYSNLAFELWLILHKQPFNQQIANKNDYLRTINQLYNTNFKSHSELTESRHFNHVLSMISISDVKNAIQNAKYLRQNKHNSNSKTVCITSKKSIRFFESNPDTLVYEIIEKIFKDCQLM